MRRARTLRDSTPHNVIEVRYNHHCWLWLLAFAVLTALLVWEIVYLPGL
jgi:hypothetical protein